MSTDSQTGMGLVIVLALFLGVAVLSLYLASIVWAFRDAAKRGKSGWLVAILVAFLSWPLGLVAWLVFRPDLPKARTPHLRCQCGNNIPVEEKMAGTVTACASCGTEAAVPELSQLRRMISEQVRRER
jgi:hypothetical protein